MIVGACLTLFQYKFILVFASFYYIREDKIQKIMQLYLYEIDYSSKLSGLMQMKNDIVRSVSSCLFACLYCDVHSQTLRH